MGVLDIQRRGQQIGRIRIGQQVKTASGKMRPERLDTFRITTRSHTTADAIAALYGGTVQEWNGELEVITNQSEIGVTVPPRDQVVSQWYEMWSKGGCQRRCSSQREQISDGSCLCPHAANPDDEDEVARKALERAMLAAKNPPEACKLITRISVMLPDLPGLGVFRIDTGSYYAGVEIGDSARLMEMARDQGIFLPAVLRIDQRARVAGGQTKRYPVPVLEILATFRQIASGELEGNMAAQLPPAPARQEAIAAGPGEVMPDGARRVVADPAHMSVPRPGTERSGPIDLEEPEAVPGGIEGTTGPGHELTGEEKYKLAQAIADDCADPAITSARFTELWKLARDRGLCDEFVYTTDDRDNGPCDPLGERLGALWLEKGRRS